MGDESLKAENERLLSEIAENQRLLGEIDRLLSEVSRLEREVELMEMSGFQPVRRTRNRNEED
jgi:hypothetical protein